MSNYAFVVDSTFQPFSMQEMLVPFSAYKDAFEKNEEAYNDLSDRSNTFKYLSDTLPEGSKARQVYEGYANDLAEQAKDFAHNGLTMGNRRALTSLRRRYQGEIGRLMKADEAMREEKKLRQSLNVQDSSRLYATDNLNIDDFLDGNNPNLYSISGNELYTRGAAAGKAASSRMTQFGDMGSLLHGLYRDIVQRNGYSAAAMQEFRRNVESIPELAEAIDDIMNASGASENLTGVNRGRARQNIINGIVDGAIYQEQHSPTRDTNVLDAATKQQLYLQKRGQNITLASQGLTYDDKTGAITYDPNKDPSMQKAAALAKIKASGKKGTSGNSSSSGSTQHTSQLSHGYRITWKGNPRYTGDENAFEEEALDSENPSYKGKITNYEDLPQWAKNIADRYINGDNYDNYDIHYRPYKTGRLWNDDAVLEIEPRKTGVINDTDPSIDFSIHE